ncbi:hypothetical protein SAMN05443247_07808 [Bradyrhizobium erythrophlei]|nr:hypothetical protein SAMN05443247_07808 [Bradyrhizobium erythrophlei]
MRLSILSDLHLELTRGWDLPAGGARPDFDVLIVAGDLIPKMGYSDFRVELSVIACRHLTCAYLG